MSAATELAKLGPLSKLKPEAMAAFGAFDAAAMGDGAVSKKTKELIAVAVALTTQCEYCLTTHTEMAKKRAQQKKSLPKLPSSRPPCALARRSLMALTTSLISKHLL